MTKYIIIGAGPAGVSAIEAIRSLDLAADIVQVCEEAAGYYSRPGLAYYLTGELSEECLFPFTADDFKRLQVHQENAQVKSIQPAQHLVELDNAKHLSYDRLLIATGARAMQTKTPGLDFEGVVKLDDLGDAHRILKYARKRRKAVVVGGGITALELVEALCVRGLEVHYFLRGNRYWSNVLDETESHIVEQRLKKEGVQYHFQTELAEILGSKGKVTGVQTTDGKLIGCDIIGIAIGIQPRKNIAESAGIKTGRGISVNEYLNTSDPDIFAAGDVAEVYDSLLGKQRMDSLWGPARKQGYTAGLNMTGKMVPYHKEVPFNITRLAGLPTTIIGAIGSREADADLVGIMRGDSEGWRQVQDAVGAQSDFDTNRLRVLVGENCLVGALLLGDQTLSRAIRYLVVNKVDISSIREKILQPGHSVAEIIADFWSRFTSGNRKQNHAEI